MRVLRLITRLNIGGPSIQAIALSDRLAARGFTTRLVHGTLGAAEGDMRYLLPQAVDVEHVPTLRREIAPARDVDALVRVLAIIREFRPRIVHTHTAKAGAVGRLAALLHNRASPRDARVRVVHTYHGHVLDGYFGSVSNALFVGIERMLAHATDRIVAISPRIKTELLEQYRVGRPGQYRVIPLGFDLAGLAAIDDDARVRARAAPRARRQDGRRIRVRERVELAVARRGRVLNHRDERLALRAGQPPDRLRRPCAPGSG